MPEVIYQGDLPAFTGRNVPIKEIASAMRCTKALSSRYMMRLQSSRTTENIS